MNIAAKKISEIYKFADNNGGYFQTSIDMKEEEFNRMCDEIESEPCDWIESQEEKEMFLTRVRRYRMLVGVPINIVV